MAGEGLVGRDGELSRLAAACRAGMAGRGSAICLVGAAGIGKTALLRAARQQAREQGLATASSWCWAEGAPPMWPWLDILGQLESSPSVLTAQDARTFRQVEAALGSAPLLIAIDDLHEADEATVLLTRYLAAKIDDLPVVLVLGQRPVSGSGPAGRLMSAMQRECEVISLLPLREAAVAQLAVAHGHPALAPEVVATLTATSGGIPIHAIAALSDSLSTDLAGHLQTGVRLRFSALAKNDAGIIARAAVLGRTVDHRAVAYVSGASLGSVARAAAAALASNFTTGLSSTSIEFSHDLVRDAILSLLQRYELIDTHASAAALYRSTSAAGPADIVRAARHAVQAAERSPADAALAIELARAAAAVLSTGGAPEDAVSLLDQALVVDEVAGGIVSRAALLVERAGAVLMAGRLGAAREAYTEATKAALIDGNPVELGEAAAGLGVLWVNTIRSPVAQRRVLAVQRRALADLPDSYASLRLRLRARIAGEAMFWEGASPEALFAVISDAHRLSDPWAGLEVLSVAHNPLLAPEYASLRMELSSEMLSLAADAPDGILSLMALCWRAVDLFLIGDHRAERALGDLREAADTAQSLSVMYVVQVMDVMQLICAGDFDAAEQTAGAAFELGTQAQDSDALSYLGAQLVAIRWFQGREQEMLELMQSIAGSPQVDVVDHSYEAAIAALAARAGQPDLAHQAFRRAVGAGVGSVPRFSTWLVTMVTLVEAAIVLDEGDTLAEIYPLLEPFGELPVSPSLAVLSFGCVHHWLGISALSMGRHDVAERHLRSAVEHNVRLGHVPATAVSRAELAELLLVHNPSASRTAESSFLLDAALRVAEDLGMAGLAERFKRPAQPVITRDSGGGWTVDYANKQVLVRDLTGVRILAVLTGSPGESFTAEHLAYGGSASPPADRQPILDAPARQAIEARMRALAVAIDRARADSDVAAQNTAESEFDELAEHLSASTGLSHRDRSFTDEAEKARTSVRKATVRAIEEIERIHPAAGAHLRTQVVTGSRCRYEKGIDLPEAR